VLETLSKRDKSYWRSLAESSQTSTSLRCIGLSDVHRTVSGAQAGSPGEQVALGKNSARHGYNSSDCPVCNAISRRRVDFANGHRAAPDYPVVRKHRGCNGRLRQKRKEIVRCTLSGGAPDCPVRLRTEGNCGLQNGAPTAPNCLGAIKGTPRHME
jgi:hypothetical protein